MSDEHANGGNGAAPNGQGHDGPGAEAQEAPRGMPLVVNAQYVKDLSFENPNAPQILMQQGQQPQIDLQVDVQARGLTETLSEVTLSIRAQANIGERTAFIVELAYCGLFSTPKLPVETAKALMLIEAPRLLFPFARQIVAESTQNGGYPPLVLQPLDFVDIYRRQVLGQAGNPPVAQA